MLRINFSHYFSAKFEKMKYRIFVILLIIIGVSCGTKKQLYKQYNGQPVTILEKAFGKPKAILENDTEKVYVFEIKKELESTEITQGKLTLDPIVTPKVKKTERYYFTVVDGIISKTKFEEEYQR